MKSITEEDKVHEQWYEEAKQVDSVEALSEFMTRLNSDYQHDYGTVCHMIASSAIAAATAANKGPQGGITGFQAGAVMWEFIQHWQGYKGPLKLLNYENLLYPQYEHTFTTISHDTWEWVQEEAKKKLSTVSEVASTVERHWQSIANGELPFSLKVEERG